MNSREHRHQTRSDAFGKTCPRYRPISNRQPLWLWCALLFAGCSASIPPPAASGPSATVTVTVASFSDVVLNSEQPVLVDCWAEWCGPCRQQAPILEEVATQYDGRAVIAKLDVDEAAELANEYEVSAIPTLLLFHGGKIVQRLEGLHTKAQIDEELDKVLGQPSQ